MKSLHVFFILILLASAGVGVLVTAMLDTQKPITVDGYVISLHDSKAIDAKLLGYGLMVVPSEIDDEGVVYNLAENAMHKNSEYKMLMENGMEVRIKGYVAPLGPKHEGLPQSLQLSPTSISTQ